MLGSTAVLVGLLLVRAGYPGADAVAALFVAALVLVSAGRLMRNNVAVLMDTADEDAESLVRGAIESLSVDASLRRLRIREAGGRHFADVVVGVPADAGLAHGHAVASAIEAAIEERAARAATSSCTSSPTRISGRCASGRPRRRSACPTVREIHNVSALRVGEGTEFSLHLKVPAGMTLDAAHAIADDVEVAIREAVPSTARVLSHIEPLSEEASGLPVADGRVHEEDQRVREVVRELTGSEPRELRFRDTDQWSAGVPHARAAARDDARRRPHYAGLGGRRRAGVSRRSSSVVGDTEPGRSARLRRGDRARVDRAVLVERPVGADVASRARWYSR